MLRNTAFALTVVLAIAATSKGAIISSVASAPTNPVNGPTGYTTDTLTFTNTDATEKFIGFNFAAPFGFFGTMNQVNPVGQPTVYQDNNAFIALVSGTPDQDSQFKVTSTQGIPVSSVEGPTVLQSAFNFTGSNNGGIAWALAQIARPSAGQVTYTGTLTIQDALGNNRLQQVSGTLGVPEPATLSLLGLAMVGGLGLVRRRNA